MNEEQCRSRLRSQFGSASASFFSSFFFFSLISLNFYQCWSLEPFLHPPSCLFIGNEVVWHFGSSSRRVVASTWSNLARLGKLSSPRWAGYFTPKSFGGPGEPKASLGLEKCLKGPFCPSPWVFFTSLTKTSNDLSFCVVTGVEQLNSTSENQDIHEW